MGGSIDRQLQWYTRRDENDVEKGPFERLALIDAVLRFDTSHKVQVRREDQVEWSTLGTHPAFRAGLIGWRPDTPEREEIPGMSGASPRLWLIAVGAFVLHLIMAGVASSRVTQNRGANVLGGVFGAFVWPLLIIGIASLWRSNRTQKTLVKVLAIVSLALVALRLVAAISINGVASYLPGAKTAEARNTVNVIAEKALAAAQRARWARDNTVVYKRCGSGQAIPGIVPRIYPYTPSNVAAADYQSGDENAGWKCLEFKMSEPQHFQYTYIAGGPYKGPTRGGPDPGPEGFEVAAEGDLNGNGVTSLFTRTGGRDPKTGRMALSPDMFVDKEQE